MASRVSFASRFVGISLSAALAGSLAGCGGGTTGGYPPPPPPYQPPAAALAKASDPKFQPLIKALVAQRTTAKELAAVNAPTGSMTEEQQKKYKELFGKTLEASQKVGAMVREAQLNAEEQAAWNAISALDDARLQGLLK